MNPSPTAHSSAPKAVLAPTRFEGPGTEEIFDRPVDRAFWVPWLFIGAIVLYVLLGPSLSRRGPETWADHLVKLWDRLV